MALPSCHDCHTPPQQATPAYFQALWLALALNGGMFVVELAGSARAVSVSLLADSLDFFADALNYGLTLWALGGAAPARRGSWVALLKGLTFVGFAVFGFTRCAVGVSHGVVPLGGVMATLGAVALVVNVGVALLLYPHRSGNANRQSAWLCSRNDAIGNAVVILAGAGVLGFDRGWPDWVVGSVLAGLGLWAGLQTLRQASAELLHPPH